MSKARDLIKRITPTFGNVDTAQPCAVDELTAKLVMVTDLERDLEELMPRLQKELDEHARKMEDANKALSRATNIKNKLTELLS